MASNKALPNPSPERHEVFSFPTPLADIFFWEKVDIKNQRVWDLNKGDPHWNTTKYPNHKLVYKRPLDQGGQFHQFFYAAPRENQDEYNWEFSQADIGGTKFDSVKRTYVTLRSAYDPLGVAQGSSMPNVPLNVFQGAYVLSGRKEIRLGEELDSLFIAEELEWVKKVSFYDVFADKSLGAGVGSKTTLYYKGEVVTGTKTIETLAAAPTDSYWGVQTSGISRECKQLTAAWYAVTENSSLEDSRLAYKLAVPSTTDLQLPAVLKEISCVWNKDAKNGSFSSDNVGKYVVFGEVSSSLGASESASADGSASIQGDIIPIIEQPNGRDIPCTNYFFFMKSTTGVISQSDVITRLVAAFAIPAPSPAMWPLFKPQSHDIVVTGQQLSISAQVSASASVSAVISGGVEKNARERTVGVGDGFSFGSSIRTVHISETIHPEITITDGKQQSQTVTATCQVGWNSYSTGTTEIAGELITLPEVDKSKETDLEQSDLDLSAGGKKLVSQTIYGSVNGATSEDPVLAATEGQNTIPTSGLFITSLKVEPYDVNWFRCHVEIINASFFA